MPWTQHPKVAAVRRRSHAVDLALDVADGFRNHITGRNTAVLAYYGVLTLFPLLMAATTILGFVLEDRPELRRDILDSALSQVPLIGQRIDEQAGNIGGSWIALIVGLLVALWGSLKAFVGAQIAFDDIWEVPVEARSNMFVQRGRALIGVAAIGVAQVGNVVLASLVGYAGLPRLGQVALTLGGLVSNVVVAATMYRFLTSRATTWREVLPGAVFAGFVFTLLQYAGTLIMTRALDSAESVYGDFAGLLALMTWISIHALVALVGAELNAALAIRRAHPARPVTVPDLAP
jgi:membrane protein